MTGAKTLKQLKARQTATTFSVAAAPALIVLGAASTGLYFWGRDLHRFTQWVAAYIGLFIVQLALYVVACYVVLRRSEHSSRAARWVILGSIIFFAIVFRAPLVPQRPYLSADVYRYIWDGRVQGAGMNPYRYTPDDPELSGLRDEKIFPNISGGDHQWLSPYPPVAQMIFLAVSLIRPMSVSAFKAAMSSFDVIALLLLMLALARSSIDPARAIIFAWHPLLIFEGAHSGHIESALIAFLALAVFAWSRGRHALTGIALGLATLAKFYPVLLLPIFLNANADQSSGDIAREGESSRPSIGKFISRVANRENLALLAAFVATVVLAYLPYIGAGRKLFGFLRPYIEEEGFTQTGARYFLLETLRKLLPIPTGVFLVFAAACFVGLAAWWLVRAKLNTVELARGASALIGLYLMLTTPRYAWYYAWIIPFLCFAPRIGWLYLTFASALLYLVWYTPLVYPEIPLWLGACIYVPTVAWLARELVKPTSRHPVDSVEPLGSRAMANQPPITPR